MRYLILSFLFFQFIFSSVQAADLKVSIELLEDQLLEERIVPVYIKLTNASEVTVSIPQKLTIPYDLVFKIENQSGQAVKAPILAPMQIPYRSARMFLGPQKTYRYPINDLRTYYRIRQPGRYQLKAVYTDQKAQYESKPVWVEVGQYDSRFGFLVFSETAYIKPQFDLVTVYPSQQSLLKSFSNQYYLIGAYTERAQIALGLWNGVYLGGKLQLIEESVWPAFALWAQFNDSKNLYFDQQYNILTRFDHSEGWGGTFSKGLWPNFHAHFLLKNYDYFFKLVDQKLQQDQVYFLGVAFDARLGKGFVSYELNEEMTTHRISEGLVYHFFSDWNPQVGIGYARESYSNQLLNQQLFLTIRFVGVNSIFKL